MSTKQIIPMRRGGDYDKLTVKQKLFCDELLADPEFNVTRAAKAAGYKQSSLAACRVLQNETIRRIIGKHLHERLERAQLRAEDVLRILWQVITLDPIDVFEKSGNCWVVKDLDLIPAEIRQCITKIRTRTRVLKDKSKEQHVEVEFMSKDLALSHALKHFGLVGADGSTTNVNVEISFQDMLDQAEKSRGVKVIDAQFIAERATAES